MIALTAFLAALMVSGDDPTSTRISDAQRDDRGWLVHSVESDYQAGTTKLRVLLPTPLDSGQRYPVVYVLPVEAAEGHEYGDGLSEVQKHNLPNKYQAIFVAPTFSHLPWYGDHPTDLRRRQESYFVHVVVPAIEQRYPVANDANGRYLLGFSKSGFGAFALLLRHPDMFGKAAAWDAPLMKDRPDQFHMEEVFATQDRFEPYAIPRLLAQRAPELHDDCRLILTGYGNFRQHHIDAHAEMTRLDIRHLYRDGPERTHDWHSGWVAESVELLFKAANSLTNPRGDSPGRLDPSHD
jgi:predicted alpha/beta superfamily hydrolase